MGKLGNFELNAEQRRLEGLRHQQRLELRQKFWKNVTDPKRHATGEGGFLFDPALQRFQAMRVSHTEHFKPTGRAAFWGFALLVAPVVILFTLAKNERQEKEHKYRNGEVSYADRQFKFI